MIIRLFAITFAMLTASNAVAQPYTVFPRGDFRTFLNEGIFEQTAVDVTHGALLYDTWANPDLEPTIGDIDFKWTRVNPLPIANGGASTPYGDTANVIPAATVAGIVDSLNYETWIEDSSGIPTTGSHEHTEIKLPSWLVFEWEYGPRWDGSNSHSQFKTAMPTNNAAGRVRERWRYLWEPGYAHKELRVQAQDKPDPNQQPPMTTWTTLGTLTVNFSLDTSYYDTNGFKYLNSNNHPLVLVAILEDPVTFEQYEAHWAYLRIQSRLDDGNGGLTPWQDESFIVVPILTEAGSFNP